MKTYSHTQRAGRWLWIPAGMAAILAGLAAWTRLWPLLGSVALLVVVAWAFGSLTVEIESGMLRWRLGPGLIRRSLALASIAEVKAVRTRWFDGWGLHYTRFGWLYNVAGFDAVALTLRDGKRVAVGTDEPTALIRAIRAATPQSLKGLPNAI